MMSVPSSTDAPKHFSNIRRSRPSYSCENCRSRRVKCDQVHPRCGNCVRNQVACVYSSTNPKRKTASDQDRGSSGSRKVNQAPGEEAAENTTQGYLVTQPGGRSIYIERSFWASVDSERLELNSLLSDLPIFPEDDEIPDEDEDREEPAEYLHDRGPSNFWMSQNHAHDTKFCPKQMTLLRQLPPEHICLQLYSVFLEGVHPLIPLIHLTSFESSFKRFWEWYDLWDRQSVTSGILTANPSFLPLLFAVLFTGSLARRSTNGVTNDPLDAPEYATITLYKMALSSLEVVAFPQNPGLHSLMAYVLVNSMLIREEEALSSCSFVALSIRIAQAMGIHKDGSSFKLDAIQTEERRRVWAHLMHLDVMTACFSGLPLVASSEMYSNTKMMSELHDKLIQEPAANFETTTPDLTYPGYTLAVGRYAASTMIRKILLRQYAPDPLRLVHIRSLAEQIEMLRANLDTRIDRLKAMENQPSLHDSVSQILSTGLPSAPTLYSGALVGWSVKLLQLMVEKAYVVLYQPITSNKDIWHAIRAEAIPHYQRYIEIYQEMSTTPGFQPFQWLYPQSYQPLHPTAVLLIDCMKESSSPEMATSTIIIRNIFSLVGPEGRITNGSINTEHGMSQFRTNKGAKRAWDILAKLRIRVWNRLGLSLDNLPDSRLPGSQIAQQPIEISLDHRVSQMPVAFDGGFVSDTSGNVANFGSPDGLLVDELQSFSQNWFPSNFYSVPDPMSGVPNPVAPINFMAPDVMPYDWSLGTNLQQGFPSIVKDSVPDAVQQ